MASLVANEAPMYSAFINEKATICCFLLTQLIAPFVNTNVNSIMDLLKSKFLPQSEFEKPLKVIHSSFPQYCSHRSYVP
jgi:hypothetical protein